VSDFHFVWSDKVFPIGVSIGAVLLAPGQMSMTDALRVADAACYIAKERGRNRVHLSSVDDQAIQQREGEMNWVGRIHEALREQRFMLYTQRLQGLGRDNGAEDHHEVLVRMLDPNGGLIAPAAFIPAAERYGLMPQIDRWIVGTVLAHAAAGSTTYAINLSGTTVCDETFLAFVQQSFRDHGTDPERICFEITETAAIANLRQATTLIRELKVMGCRFSLDDFGSGMSSFAYLKHLPVDYLKIDGSFVKDMLDDPVNRAMVESINHIGHVMKLRTVAEFVENDAVLDALRAIGVDYAQGYGVQKPVPMGTGGWRAVA
jgi:EAL domain-containing protein (putative c-di-GMP-specific phosphodiesterase class I)